MLAAALGGGAWLVLRDDETRRVRARIAELAQALACAPGDDRTERAARIERSFEEALSADVLVKIPDYPALGRGRTELVELARRAGDDPRGLEVRVRHVEVALGDADRSARARLDAELSRPGDELHKDVRTVQVAFDVAGGAWRVTSIEVGERSRAEPEARP